MKVLNSCDLDRRNAKRNFAHTFYQSSDVDSIVMGSCDRPIFVENRFPRPTIKGSCQRTVNTLKSLLVLLKHYRVEKESLDEVCKTM